MRHSPTDQSLTAHDEFFGTMVFIPMACILSHYKTQASFTNYGDDAPCTQSPQSASRKECGEAKDSVARNF